MNAYPAYRAAESAWQGRAPEHWTTSRLKFMASVNPRRGTPALADDDEVSFVPMEAIGERGELDLTGTRPVGELTTGYTYFADGDVILAKITPCFENGKGARADGLLRGVGFGTTELHVVRPGPDVDGRYLYYLTQCHPFRSLGEGEMYGAGGQKRVPEDFVRDFSPAWPPLAEQQGIGAFLDQQVATIDALVDTKQRLLDALERKRQAQITHAITEGLNPGAPRKATGIPWLGSIPAHWTVKRLKFIAPAITVGIVVTPARYYVDDGVPCLRSLNVKPGRLSRDELVFMSDASNELHAKSKLRAGDIVAVRTGKPGTTAVVDDYFDGGNCIDLILIRRSEELNSRFLAHIMNSGVAHAQYEMGAEGALQQHFNIETAKNLVVAEPPRAEQDQIADFLDARLGELDRTREALTRQIERLRLHRQALITAAVTGQIDVRVHDARTAG